MIGTVIGILYLSRKEKLQWLRVHDYVACCVPFGLFFGRIANFVNHDDQERSRSDRRLKRVGRCAQSVKQASGHPDQAAAERACRGEREAPLPAERKRDLPSEERLRLPFLDRCDEAVAVFRDGLYETRLARIVAERPPQMGDALAERFVGDRNPVPDVVKETVARNQLPRVADHQQKRVQVAAVHLDRRAVAFQLALGSVDDETVELELRPQA